MKEDKILLSKLISSSNGSYTQYCDLNRQYDPNPSPNTTTGLPNGTVVPPYNGSGIDTFVEAFGRHDLLEYMRTYWVSQGSSDASFWGVSPITNQIPRWSSTNITFTARVLQARHLLLHL